MSQYSEACAIIKLAELPFKDFRSDLGHSSRGDHYQIIVLIMHLLYAPLLF